MATAEVDSGRRSAARWWIGLLGAFGLASLGLVVWYVVETVFGRIDAISPYLGVFAIAVGGLAGYGALIGSGRARGWSTQIVALLATLPVLAAAQALVVRLMFVRELEALGYTGATFRLPLREWWEYVSWALFSTSPPSIFYWALALAYALAVPRAYRYEDHR